jgi:hypothetical protein
MTIRTIEINVTPLQSQEFANLHPGRYIDQHHRAHRLPELVE